MNVVPAATQPGDFRADINGLRGLSVALVVAYHLQLRGAGGGFVGVDVFFVLSGYLMTQILLRGHAASWAGVAGFVAARARRIWPALAVLVTLLLLAGAAALPPFDLASLAEQALWALPFASNHFYLAHSGYADRTADDLWLLHTWSLSVEWQFYLLYPLLVFAMLAMARRRQPAAPPAAGPRRALLATLVVLSAASLAWQVLQRGEPLESGFFPLASRAWELLAGGIAYLGGSASTTPAGRGQRLACHAGIGLILASALGLAALRLRPVGLDFVLLGPVLGTALVLWATDVANPVLRLAALQALGRWSYSIYLWHWPIIIALRLTPWWHEQRVAAVLAALASSVLAGALSYRWVERPWLTRRTPPGAGPVGRGVAAAVVVMLLAVALAGVAATTQRLALRERLPAVGYADYEASVRPLLFPDERCGNFKLPAEAMVVCTVERGAGRRLLVIGDSHAGHLWPWFTKHSQVSVDFFQAAECPPVPRFERLQPGYRCKDYSARAWQMALTPVYDTVVVSARWATVGLAGPPYCHEAAAGRCDVVGSAGKQALVLDEVRAAIERTLRAGKVVVLLDSAPEAAVRVPKQLAREQFWYGRPRLSIDRASMIANNSWVDGLFDELRALPGFHLVSLRSSLCGERSCRVYDDTLARPIYFDESHFDPVWIAENARFFDPFVQRERASPSQRP